VRPIFDKAIEKAQKGNGDVADRVAGGFTKMVLGATSGVSVEFQPDDRFIFRIRTLLFFGETKKGTWRVAGASGNRLTVSLIHDETGEKERCVIEFQDDDNALLTIAGEGGEPETLNMTRVVEKD
jgi:hypothetical protein